MMMSTPFAFDIVESSMRIMVDGDDIRVCILECSYCATMHSISKPLHSFCGSVRGYVVVKSHLLLYGYQQLLPTIVSMYVCSC